MNKYYIYLYLDKRFPGHYIFSNVCFLFRPLYVGRGKGRRYEIYDHKHSTGIVTKKIKKLGKSLIGIVFLEQHLSYEESVEREIFYIRLIGREDLGAGYLCNLTDGGEGCKSPSIEVRIKIRAARKKQVISEVTKQKISETLKCRYASGEILPRPRSESARKAAGDRYRGTGPMFGKHHSIETKNKMRRAHLGRPKPKSLAFRKRVSETMKKYYASGESMLAQINRNRVEKHQQLESNTKAIDIN